MPPSHALEHIRSHLHSLEFYSQVKFVKFYNFSNLIQIWQIIFFSKIHCKFNNGNGMLHHSLGWGVIFFFAALYCPPWFTSKLVKLSSLWSLNRFLQFFRASWAFPSISFSWSDLLKLHSVKKFNPHWHQIFFEMAAMPFFCNGLTLCCVNFP